MKYLSYLKNAGQKAERFFRSRLAFLVFTGVLLICIVSAVRFVNTSRENEIRARRGIYLMMESDMEKCVQIGVKMQYAGANIEGKLLPELKTYLYSLKNMSDAFNISFGEEYAPVQAQFLSKVESACERLSRDLKNGYPADASQKALVHCLNEFSKILDGWDFE